MVFREAAQIMPKPDLVALTGGYRRIPVLQIGADVFCDTRLIAKELERVQLSASLFPDAARTRLSQASSQPRRLIGRVGAVQAANRPGRCA